MSAKKVVEILRGSRPHWVGDGFPVRSVFSYHDRARELSPFLLLDYAAPHQFEATERRRGVGAHPHKGFETVTLVYQGELEHRDSSGGGGVIGPGQVQWMTAGQGIVHEEYHSPAFAASGGTLEMIQLWVNLRAQDKGAPAGYQTLSEIPEVDGVRVIAGEFRGVRGPARTFTRINLWEVNGSADLRLPEGDTAAVLVLRGEWQGARSGDLVRLSAAGEELRLDGFRGLVLSGEPIDEPVVGHGPFVMNTREEIAAAFAELG
jgi:redox-sensitive bicupin YhaK (pirin superfamily)